jgi:two-component sensor histidine kinase
LGFKDLNRVRGTSAIWWHLVPDRPGPVLRGHAVAIGVTLAAALARWAAAPLIGAEVSFITSLPAVLIATLYGGRAPGVMALVVGSAFDLLFSTASTGGSLDHALPRLVVWVCSAIFIVVVALQLRGTVIALRRRERDLIAASEQHQLLIRELEHRGRNALAIVQAISSDTAQTAASIDEYRWRLSDRLAALSHSYTTLTSLSDEAVDVLALVTRVLTPFGKRVSIVGGPACGVGRDACIPLTLALHELATNASKYGALSAESGEVVVEWNLHTRGQLELHWAEHGGPPPSATTVEGFGSLLLRRLFERVDGGGFQAIRRPEGMVFQIRLQFLGE